MRNIFILSLICIMPMLVSWKEPLEKAETSPKEEHSDNTDPDEAIEKCTKAIQINPKDADAYFECGLARADKDDYDAAIKMDSEDVVAYYNRGVAHANKGDLNTAIKNYSKAIKIDPEYAMPIITAELHAQIEVIMKVRSRIITMLFR